MASRLDSDKIMSLSAIIVSLGTLFLILYQTNLIRKEQKASVMPSLFIGYSTHNNSERIQLRNQGLGPAFIQEIHVRYKDTTYDADPFEFLLKAFPDQNQFTENMLSFDRIFPGRIIPQNDFIVMYSKLDSTPANLIRDLFAYSFTIPGEDQNRAKAVVEIIYENVYGDRWKIGSNKAIPEKL